MLAKTFLLSALAAAASAQKYFIVFGDSYTQTGFDPFGTQPSASNVLGNPALPGWTSSGGLNWVGDLITKYNSSLTLTYNFAYGGATVNGTTVAPYAPSVLSLIDQVTNYTLTVGKKPATAAWTANNSLFAIWIGINDVGMSWWLSNFTSTILPSVFDDYFEQVAILYNTGARNFVFLNVPPTERSPYVISLGTDAVNGLKAGITQFNAELATRVANFKASHSDATAVLVDTQGTFNKILDAGGSKSTCYNSDGVTCLWYNDYHPGLVIHDAVAQSVAAAESAFF